ncbi:hypothetical protein GQ600_7253 [Phytophthora cactorum]|nr:hypothetical protein GQ600_7253 [Phytophthora cactorum]
MTVNDRAWCVVCCQTNALLMMWCVGCQRALHDSRRLHEGNALEQCSAAIPTKTRSRAASNRKRRMELNERKKLLRKAGIYGDDNWMSKDSRLEIAYLHERIEKLHLDFQVLQSRKSRQSATQTVAQKPTDTMDLGLQIPKPCTIVEEFTKELFSRRFHADIKVKQVIRRYSEPDRDIVIWVARVSPAEIKHKSLSGLTYHLRGYAVTKSSSLSTPGQEVSQLQCCSMISLDQDDETRWQIAFKAQCRNKLVSQLVRMLVDRLVVQHDRSNLFVRLCCVDKRADGPSDFAGVLAVDTGTLAPPKTSTGDSTRGQHYAATDESLTKRARANARKKLLRQAGIYSDPNKARNERTREITFLHRQIEKLQIDLQLLQSRQTNSQTGVNQPNAVALIATRANSQISCMWQEQADRQQRRREAAERDNVRLKFAVERQRKVATSLASLMKKRSTQLSNTVDVLDFCGDIGDFRALFKRVDDAYRDVDAVFQSHGLARSTTSPGDVHMREGVEGKFLEFSSYKILPYEMRAATEAVWEHFKGVEKHLGVEQNLDEPYTIIEDFSIEIYSNSSRADYKTKQVVRRYVEEDRDIVIWVSHATPVEVKHKLLSGKAEARGAATYRCASVGTPNPKSVAETRDRQRQRREEAEETNVRLKLALEHHQKLTNALRHGTIFAANGLAHMDITPGEVHFREQTKGKYRYLEFFSNNILPFELNATKEATWAYFKGIDKHLGYGNLYSKAAKVFPYEVTSVISCELTTVLLSEDSLGASSQGASLPTLDDAQGSSNCRPQEAQGGRRQRQPLTEEEKKRRKTEFNERRRLLRKTGVYGNANRARNERAREIAYQREQMERLQIDLQILQTRHAGKPCNQEKASVLAKTNSESKITSMWQELAAQQRRRREEAERDNVLLRLAVERQRKVANTLQSQMKRRATQLGLDEPYTIIADFKKELYANSSRADIKVKQVIRRYVEEDRDIVLLVSRAVPIEIKHKILRGLTYHLQGYAVTKRSTEATPDREASGVATPLFSALCGSSESLEDSTDCAATYTTKPKSKRTRRVAKKQETEEEKMRRKAERNEKRKLLRKAGVYGDANRARNERSREIAYLRDQMEKLQLDLRVLQTQRAKEKSEKKKQKKESETALVRKKSTQITTMWQGLAEQQKRRREEAERDNVLLKLAIERQTKVADNLRGSRHPYTLIADLKKEVFSNSSRADIRVKQAVRRYIEEDRDVIAWTSRVVPIEIKHKLLRGLTYHLRGYAITKRSPDSTPEGELSVLQLCYLVSLDQDIDTTYGHDDARTITDFMIVSLGQNMRGHREFIENALAALAFLEEYEFEETKTEELDSLSGQDEAVQTLQEGSDSFYSHVPQTRTLQYRAPTELCCSDDKLKRKKALNEKRKILRRTGVYGDPNRSRNERKKEIAFLREQLQKLQLDLRVLRSRAAEHSQGRETDAKEGDTLDFRGNIGDFHALFRHLDAAKLELDTMLANNGLANMTLSPIDVHIREDFDGNYMEFFTYKEVPLTCERQQKSHGTTGKEWRSTSWATEACIRRRQRYDPTGRSLISTRLYSNTARADVQVKQVVRRYVEGDRDIIIWVARLTPTEIKHKILRGLTYNLRGQVVIKRSPHSTPEQESSVLQQCSLIYLDEESRLRYDPSTGASSAALLLVDDIELLSPSLTPLTSTLPTNYASPGAGSDTSMTSPSSPAFRLSKDPSARLELGLPAAGTVSTKRKTVGRGRKKTTGGPKKPVTRGDPNRARNERKIELAYLREKVSQLELELRALKLHPRTQTRAIRHQGDKQRTEAMKKDSESDSIMSVYDPVEVPTVWKEVASRQRRRREKAERENVRLKLILENQIRMARGLESLLQKRAKQQVVECSSLSQSKKSNARADFHAKQVLRRYVEEDREIVIWVASVVPLEFDDQRVKGLGFRHQGYAVTKRAKASKPNREFSLLQLCSLVSPEKEDHTVYDPAAVRALTDFMLGTVAGNITASQELIENVLMDQAVNPQDP